MNKPYLYRLFENGIIPHANVEYKNSELGYSGKSDIVSMHSEIPRKEYNYVWNKHGLRSIDFELKPEIITMGCSITFGLGLPNGLRWNSMLQEKIKNTGMKIGDLSYNGASPVKNISSFFGFIKSMDYLPKYVICNFSNFERSYFPTSNIEYMNDLFWYKEEIISKAYAPFEYSKILPVEWIYYLNLEYIKMLEVFCKTNNINLIWSTWSTNFSEEMEEYIKDTFESYTPDTTRLEFPSDFEYGYYAKTKEDLPKFFKMKNWDSIECHKDLYDQYKDIFDYAYDYHQIPVNYAKGLVQIHAHPGIHRHAHWSEMYYNKIFGDKHGI